MMTIKPSPTIKIRTTVAVGMIGVNRQKRGMSPERGQKPRRQRNPKAAGWLGLSSRSATPEIDTRRSSQISEPRAAKHFAQRRAPLAPWWQTGNDVAHLRRRIGFAEQNAATDVYLAAAPNADPEKADLAARGILRPGSCQPDRPGGGAPRGQAARRDAGRPGAGSEAYRCAAAGSGAQRSAEQKTATPGPAQPSSARPSPTEPCRGRSRSPRAGASYPRAMPAPWPSSADPGLAAGEHDQPTRAYSTQAPAMGLERGTCRSRRAAAPPCWSTHIDLGEAFLTCPNRGRWSTATAFFGSRRGAGG